MDNDSYFKKLGLKCGLECHQQLDTGKLFSRTPSKLREDEPEFTIKRRLRIVSSELGEMDKAGIEAFKKSLKYIYEGYKDTISLVEIDEEPPQPIDKEALKIALQIALMFGSQPIEETFIMRKMVIDGSNTSGFQRTTLLATGGEIKLKNKTIGIQTIVLEEDAARPIKKTETEIYYRLDRLGIPLIELATEPEIETPEEAKETAKAIGTTFRLTGKVKRGLGTIRQDLNVSIKEGTRVEIKGIQDLEIIDEYVKREAQRQTKLIEAKKELEKRGLKKQDIKTETKYLEEALTKSESKIIKAGIANKERIIGIKLPKFNGILGIEIQPNRRIGTEFADRVKTKSGLKGIFHSDELPNYGITQKEKEEIAKILECKKEDAFAFVVGKEEKAKTAIEAIVERAIQCLDGVPEETRGALEGGNTEYLRPLPGAARMYPETDLESITITQEMIEEAKKSMPKSETERIKLYQKWGLNEKHINEMKLSNFAPLFEKEVEKGADPKKTAVFLLETLTEAKREGANIEELNENAISEIINLIKIGKAHKEILKDLVIMKSKNPDTKTEILLENLTGKTSYEEAEKTIKEIVKNNIEIIKKQKERAISPLMGDAMKQLKGKISGKEISEILKKHINEALK